MHHPKWYHTRGVRTRFLENWLLVQQIGGFSPPPPLSNTHMYVYSFGYHA